MWQKALIVSSVALLVLVLLGSLPATAQSGEGVVHGQVANWTEGAGNVSQLEVTLNTYQGTIDLGTTTATTDDQGVFEFTGLATEADHAYQLTLVYQEAEYDFEPFSFEGGETDREANLVVYDSTSDDQSIRINRSHMIIKVEPGSLLVTEYYLFVNDGDRTYTGSGEVGAETKETLQFSLPEQAADLEVGEGLMECCIVRTENGFADTMVFWPGPKEILFSYRLNYTSETYNLPLTLLYPVDSFDLMVEGEHLEVSSDRLTPGELPGMEGEQITYYTGNDLERNTTLDIRLSGLTPSESGGPSWSIIIPSVLALGLAVGFVVWLRNRSRPAALPEWDRDIPDRETLLREIARLDDAFERGDISEEDYLKQRRERKTRLVELMRRSGS